MKRWLIACCWLGVVGFARGEELEVRLDEVVAAEMRDWGLTGVAVALIDDQELVLSKGYGEARKDSVFRVGSISKLFNAIAVMQQVEAGRLDLDAPIPDRWLPWNPFPDRPAVTLRQILCHRSGLQREGRVGGYLDPSEPGLEASIASLRQGVLVTEPSEKMRYSNIAPSLAGFLVSRAVKETYSDYQRRRILGPLGMKDSAWLRHDIPAGRLVRSFMRVADGNDGWTRRETPVFDLGTIPAGNLFSTVGDLAKFASAMLRGGDPLVSKETLAVMWQAQLTDSEFGFGLGFSVGQYRDHRTVSHSGAVYGHSTSLMILPDAKLACVVLVNEDIANGRVRRISRAALDQLLFERRAIPRTEEPLVYAGDDVERFSGKYESESYWAELKAEKGKLVGDLSGQPTVFTRTGERTFNADNRITHRGRTTFSEDDSGNVIEFTLSGQRYRRVIEGKRTVPVEWKNLLGSYGHDFIPLIVSEKFGHLYVMTENMVDYRIRPENRNTWNLPRGMYVDEEVVFFFDATGRVPRINFANMVFDRLEVNP